MVSTPLIGEESTYHDRASSAKLDILNKLDIIYVELDIRF
jgi:hypothetical protein